MQINLTKLVKNYRTKKSNELNKKLKKFDKSKKFIINS